mmetsp:Transcript_6945/g.13116  ORF Transcript_6945/g.13116 Transcript_6945/m.13116 type:complete len:102 (-) Transcript_6945:1234-1539(-)
MANNFYPCSQNTIHPEVSPAVLGNKFESKHRYVPSATIAATSLRILRLSDDRSTQRSRRSSFSVAFASMSPSKPEPSNRCTTLLAIDSDFAHCTTSASLQV